LARLEDERIVSVLFRTEVASKATRTSDVELGDENENDEDDGEPGTPNAEDGLIGEL
jgi:hypothetical protein